MAEDGGSLSQIFYNKNLGVEAPARVRPTAGPLSQQGRRRPCVALRNLCLPSILLIVVRIADIVVLWGLFSSSTCCFGLRR